VSRRAVDLLLTVAGLLLVQLAVWLIRPAFWEASNGQWPWALLVLGALIGGSGLRRMERWLPDPSPQGQPMTGHKPKRQRVGVTAMILALGLVAWVVVQLWPQYRQWQGTLLPWIGALTLVLAGGLLMRRVGEPSGDYASTLLRHDNTRNDGTDETVSY